MVKWSLKDFSSYIFYTFWFSLGSFRREMAAAANTSISSISSSDEDEVLPKETTKEQNNRNRLQLFLPLGQEALLNNFHNNDTQSFSRDPHKLYLELQEKKPQIDRLKSRSVLKQDQYDLLIPPSGDTVDSTKFDITLLMVLLVNFCGFEYPMKNWIPQQTDTDTFANIVRVKKLRDQVSHKTDVSDADFKQIVSLFTQSLLALGVSQEKIDNVLKMRIADEVTKKTLQKYEQSQTSFNHSFIPPVANFFSRDQELDELHNKMTKSFGSKFGVVLCGLPGVGKSETARQYWIKYRKPLYEDIIVWVNAENVSTMECEFQDIGDECGVQKIKKPDGNYVEPKKLVDFVYRHFAAKLTASSRKVLFVFDGADDQDALYQFLPKCIDYAPYILITSQCKNWDKRFDHLELEVFNNEDALKFFTDNTIKSQYTDDVEIKELLSALSCHPLALQQALSYIQENSTTVNEYLSLLHQRTDEIMSKSVEQIGNPSVNKTMTTSINRLKTINADVGDLLDILAHLDGKEVKKGFLLMFFNNDQFRLNKTLTLLRKYSIINFETNTNIAYSDQVIRIHSLTQLFLESNQDSQNLSKQLEKIANIFIDDLSDCKNVNKPQDGKLWINHFYKINENKIKKPTILNSFIDKQNLLIELLESKGNYVKLLEIFQYISESIIEQTHPSYLITKHNIAQCYRKMNNLEKALQLYQEVEELKLKTLGPTSN